MSVAIKRVYDDASTSDGFRVLVDRLWPRGISKDRAKLDLWLKDIGPSDELRQWFNHDPAKFEQFATRYKKELADNPAVEELRKVINDNDKVTLLYGAKDPDHNQAVVLKDYL